MNINDIKKTIKEIKSYPSKTIIYLLILLFLAIGWLYIQGYVTEKGKQSAQNLDKEIPDTFQIRGDQSPIINASSNSQVPINYDTSEIKIHGDFVSGNKTVIEKQINLSTAALTQNNNEAKIDVAKLKISRAFEDFDKAIEVIINDFPKESKSIAAQFNAQGILESGMHIKSQMDLSVGTKKKLDQEYEGLKRKIEDVLVETLEKTSLQSAGLEFGSERNRLDEAEKRCLDLYPLLNDNPKSWEKRALNETQLTKDFDVANDHKN